MFDKLDLTSRFDLFMFAKPCLPRSGGEIECAERSIRSPHVNRKTADTLLPMLFAYGRGMPVLATESSRTVSSKARLTTEFLEQSKSM